ncbi:MAG: 50S ribosomal protein L25 [Planctomycetota bacterium]|nr:50S ribosomal protein L25 [Planctomycetota bacterium]
MLANIILKVEARTELGKRRVSRLRKGGKVPGVLYGHGQEAISLVFNGKEFSALLMGGTRVVDLARGTEVEKAVIRDVQFDHLGMEILHVDFARVSADERIKVDVPVEVRGISPGVTSGGILEHLLHSLHIECLASAVPESIRLRVDELQKGQSIKVKDLKLPEGVRVVNDSEAVVVHIVEPKGEVVATPGEGGASEPEMVVKKKPVEDKKED